MALVVSIPQAVSAVATVNGSLKTSDNLVSFNTTSGRAVATWFSATSVYNDRCFNTASGRAVATCNFSLLISFSPIVSIPQAVGLLQLCVTLNGLVEATWLFQYRKR